MALHRVERPTSARLLFRVVAMQKSLLKALTEPTLTADDIDTAWVQGVWQRQDHEWVRRFCLGGQESVIGPLTTLAGAPLLARQSLYAEFCRQNKVPSMLATGGDFRDLATLPGFNTALAGEVATLFKRCYELLGHKKGIHWSGYILPCGTVSKSTYRSDYEVMLVTRSVCPYCDGDIGISVLDHYYAKDLVPLLACNPWNLVPVCDSCNKVGGKADNPAYDVGPPRSTRDWLHPFERPASDKACIVLNGPPARPLPELHSANADEVTPLQNHTRLIRTLASRWNGKITAYVDRLTGEVRRERHLDPNLTPQSLVAKRLDDHKAAKGTTSNTLIQAAVCQAVLDRRPGYLEEIFDSNPPTLA